MRILLTGGGTGGHIIPHASIIDKIIRNKDLKFEFLYVGSKSGLEKKFCIEQNIKCKEITTGKFRRYFSIKNIIDWFKIPIGIIESYFIIRKFNPDVIFSKGGYVAVPPVIAGWLLKKKIIIHESDYSPGLATKLTSRIAKIICVSHTNTRSKLPFSVRKKTIITGSPIRPIVLKGNTKKAHNFLLQNHKKIKFNKNIILIIGGSTGAQKINELIWSILPKLLANNIVIHVTGKSKGIANNKKHSLIIQLEQYIGEDLWNNYFEFEYINKELPDIYAIADLVISRAGAGAVTELHALGIPSILIPLSHGSRGDQFENAIHMGSKANTIIDQNTVTADQFLEIINKHLKNKKILSKKENFPLQNLIVNADKKIANLIINA